MSDVEQKKTDSVEAPSSTRSPYMTVLQARLSEGAAGWHCAIPWSYLEKLILDLPPPSDVRDLVAGRAPGCGAWERAWSGPFTGPPWTADAADLLQQGFPAWWCDIPIWYRVYMPLPFAVPGYPEGSPEVVANYGAPFACPPEPTFEQMLIMEGFSEGARARYLSDFERDRSLAGSHASQRANSGHLDTDRIAL